MDNPDEHVLKNNNMEGSFGGDEFGDMDGKVKLKNGFERESIEFELIL